MPVATQVAEHFGRAVAEGDFAAAHAMLTKKAQLSHSPAELAASVEKMISIGDGPITDFGLVNECVLEDWPRKQQDDVGYVYVALNGNGFCEAVTVTLCREGDEIRIRELEWGRP